MKTAGSSTWGDEQINYWSELLQNSHLYFWQKLFGYENKDFKNSPVGEKRFNEYSKHIQSIILLTMLILTRSANWHPYPNFLWILKDYKILHVRTRTNTSHWARSFHANFQVLLSSSFYFTDVSKWNFNYNHPIFEKFCKLRRNFLLPELFPYSCSVVLSIETNDVSEMSESANRV